MLIYPYKDMTYKLYDCMVWLYDTIDAKIVLFGTHTHSQELISIEYTMKFLYRDTG